MSLEGKLRAEQIVVRAGLSSRPGFYSGRGATATDLRYEILEKVYQEVKREHGEEAARQFVQMVSDTPKLTATDFLLNLYRLEGHDWRWDYRLLGKEKGLYPEDAGTAVWTVLSVMSGMSPVDETPRIRDEFLRRHGVEPPVR